MQIERLNYLVFPPESKPPAGAKDTSTSKSATPPVLSTPTLARPSIPVLNDRVEDAIAPSAVVIISTPIAKPKDIANTAAPYYSREGKTSAPPATPNLEAMEQAHQRATERASERSASAVPQLSLDKDGIMVARPLVSDTSHATSPTGSAFSHIHPQGDFVSLAVSAMRQFKDDTERQNRYATALVPTPPEGPVGPLRSLQQLASRFNLFA